MRTMRNLYIFVGRSGSGKTSVTECLKTQYGMRTAESYTDRPRRFPEEKGHRFVTGEEFAELGTLVAVTTFNGYHYGMTPEQVSGCDFLILEPSGVLDIKRLMRDDPNARPIKVIGIHAAESELENRMRMRGDSDAAIQVRLANDKAVFAGLDDISDVVFHNRTLDETVAVIWAYITVCELQIFSK